MIKRRLNVGPPTTIGKEQRKLSMHDRTIHLELVLLLTGSLVGMVIKKMTVAQFSRMFKFIFLLNSKKINCQLF